MKKQIAALAADDGHMVMWDIDSLLSDLREVPSQSVATALLTPRAWVTIDTDYAMTADVSKPILLFELPQDLIYIADGNHRLYRAVTEGIENMQVILIPREIHLKYLFQSSEEIYRHVVAGLKEEGIFIPDFRSKS